MTEKEREVLLCVIKMAEDACLSKRYEALFKEANNIIQSDKITNQPRMAIGHDGHLFTARIEDKWMVQQYIDEE